MELSGALGERESGRRQRTAGVLAGEKIAADDALQAAGVAAETARGFDEIAGVAKIVCAGGAAGIGPAPHENRRTESAIVNPDEQYILLRIVAVSEHPSRGQSVHVIFQNEGNIPGGKVDGREICRRPALGGAAEQELSLKRIDKTGDADADAQGARIDMFGEHGGGGGNEARRIAALANFDLLQGISSQPKPADIGSARLKRQANEMSGFRIDFQGHARPARAGNARRAFAQQPVAQHRLGEHPNSVWGQTGSLVQVGSAQPAPGPDHAKDLSLPRVEHDETIPMRAGARPENAREWLLALGGGQVGLPFGILQFGPDGLKMLPVAFGWLIGGDLLDLLAEIPRLRFDRIGAEI